MPFRKPPTPKDASKSKKADIAFKTPKTSSMPAQEGLGFHPPYPTWETDAQDIVQV